MFSDLAAVMVELATRPSLANRVAVMKALTTNAKDTVSRRKSGVLNPKFDKLIEKIRSIHDKKNNDYASAANPYSNFEEAAEFAGVTVDQVFAVLIGIKEARLKELLSSNKTPNNESIQDTRIDAATYACLRASYHLEEHENKEEFTYGKWEPNHSPKRPLC